MAITALNELGYDNITDAADVGEAKNLLKGKKFDLIISDWHMPGESGLDFLKYVKATPEYTTIPFVLQTTENEKKNIVEAVKAGVSGYLFKPVQKNALAQKMLELSKIHKFQAPLILWQNRPPMSNRSPLQAKDFRLRRYPNSQQFWQNRISDFRLMSSFGEQSHCRCALATIATSNFPKCFTIDTRTLRALLFVTPKQKVRVKMSLML